MATTIEFVVGPTLAGERLDRTIAQEARERGVELSNRRAKMLIEEGHVRIGGQRIRHASHRVAQGNAVSMSVDTLSVTRVIEQVDIGPAVIYRDDVLIAIAKPSGLPTHATHDPDRDHAQACVQRLLGDGAYVAVHHRLDVETSGVLVFAIDRAANKGLADAFANRTAQKRYIALVANPKLPDAFDVEDHLGRDRHQAGRMTAVHSGGDAALTNFEVRSRSDTGAIVIARPRTGRTHQIRVHLSGFGAPIVGDVMYGGVSATRVMLHAQRLVLPHPTTGEALELTAPVPDDFALTTLEYGMELD